VFTITCNEDMKGNAKCKNSRLSNPLGNLGATDRVHLWLDGKRIVDFAGSHGCGIIKRNLSKSVFSEGVGHFECKF